MSDTEVQETLDVEVVALGVTELQAETVMLEGVVTALAGEVIKRVEIPRIKIVEAEQSV